MGERRLTVLDLVLAVALTDVAQLLLVVAEQFHLPGIVPVDHLFHRFGAGHRRARAEHRGRGSEREAGEVPQRLQQRRPHPPLRQHLVELGEVLAFLRGHLPDHRRGAAAPEHPELALVDAHRAVLAGVVDAQDAVDQLLFRQVAGQTAGTRCRLVHGTGFRRSDTSPARQPRLSSVDAIIL